MLAYLPPFRSGGHKKRPSLNLIAVQGRAHYTRGATLIRGYKIRALLSRIPAYPRQITAVRPSQFYRQCRLRPQRAICEAVFPSGSQLPGLSVGSYNALSPLLRFVMMLSLYNILRRLSIPFYKYLLFNINAHSGTGSNPVSGGIEYNKTRAALPQKPEE